MATLTANVQRFGTNFLGTPFSCAESTFAVSTTTIFIRDSAGVVRSWQNGRPAIFNNLPNGDDIPPYGAFQVLPKAQIETDDSKLSFGTPIPMGSGGETTGNAFSSGFGA